jgi:hypothetical protein
MTTLFVTHPGQVTSVPGDIGRLPMQIFMTGWVGFPAIRAVMTHIGVQNSGNYQLLHTLKEFVYLYVFGERVGDIAISGLLFSEACGPDVDGGSQKSGFEQLCQYYSRFRVAVNPNPITILVGVSGLASFQGFLVGQKLEIMDPQQQLGQFTLFVKTLTPEALSA